MRLSKKNNVILRLDKKLEAIDLGSPLEQLARAAE